MKKKINNKNQKDKKFVFSRFIILFICASLLLLLGFKIYTMYFPTFAKDDPCRFYAKDGYTLTQHRRNEYGVPEWYCCKPDFNDDYDKCVLID